MTKSKRPPSPFAAASCAALCSDEGRAGPLLPSVWLGGGTPHPVSRPSCPHRAGTQMQVSKANKRCPLTSDLHCILLNHFPEPHPSGEGHWALACPALGDADVGLSFSHPLAGLRVRRRGGPPPSTQRCGESAPQTRARNSCLFVLFHLPS